MVRGRMESPSAAEPISFPRLIGDFDDLPGMPQADEHFAPALISNGVLRTTGEGMSHTARLVPCGTVVQLKREHALRCFVFPLRLRSSQPRSGDVLRSHQAHAVSARCFRLPPAWAALRFAAVARPREECSSRSRLDPFGQAGNRKRERAARIDGCRRRLLESKGNRDRGLLTVGGSVWITRRARRAFRPSPFRPGTASAVPSRLPP